MKRIEWALIVSATLLGGCVQPGSVDPSLINRYQSRMAQRGPQQRGQDGLDFFEPTETTQPALKIVEEPDSDTTRVFLGLDEAVMRSLANSLDIRVISFDPAVSREEIIKAAAEFDYVVFGQFDYGVTDEQTTVVFGGGESSQRTWEVGVLQKTPTGAAWQLSWTMDRAFDVSTFTSQQRKYDNRMTLELTQPLLRDAWPEFNLANLRIARLNHKTSREAFRQQVEQTLTDVISVYWLLVRARRDRLIQKALLDRSIETRDRIDERRVLDATDVEYQQAEAAVHIRRADLIRIEKNIQDVQDQLIRLLIDKQLNMLSDVEIVPTTRPNVEFLKMDPTDQLLTTLQHSPVLAQARLAIAIIGINVRVARNQTLPKLDFTVSTTMQGLGSTAHEARDSMETGDYVSTNATVRLEYPIGNRERIAEWARWKLERQKALTSLQNLADQVALQLRERIRQIETTYEEMKAQQLAVEAARNQLEALEATEQLRKLTPEFLQVKLSAQETLAQTQRAEVQAIINYNIALVELSQVTGTILDMHQVQIAMPAVLGEGTWPVEIVTDSPAETSEVPAED